MMIQVSQLLMVIPLESVRFYYKGESLAQQPAQPIWMSWNAYKTFGGDPQSDNQLQGGNGAGPTEQTYYVIYVNGGASGRVQQFK